MTVSKAEFTILESIATSFPKQVVSSSALQKKEIEKLFLDNTSLLQKTRLITGRLWYKLAPGSGYETRARRLVRYCEKNVAPLERVFGRDALVEAMRVQPARSASVANLAERLGGKKIAALIRQSL